MTEGLDGFAPHEALELLLCAVVPQRDVNPLAHELIARFGSLRGVLGAGAEALRGERGVGERTAEWLSFLDELTRFYASLKLDDRPKLDRIASVGTYCEGLFDGEDEEQFWVFNMNQAGHLLYSARLAQGKDCAASVSIRRVVEPALRYHAQTLVIVQNRLPGNMKLRSEEVRFAQKLLELLGMIRVQLMDDVLMCGHRLLSMRASGLLSTAEAPTLREETAEPLLAHWLDGAPPDAASGTVEP